ncbi:MAG: SDR family oxidoreductase [Planctomycetes bacterium]|nr:SDR family oxidoreductase [Planctomycetota bacterium]
MDLQLTDNVVFLTGASGGIGRALALEFAAEGAKLALVGGTKHAEMEAWLAAQPWRERALALHADTTSTLEVDVAMEKAREHFGRVDVCIANAGRWTPEAKLLHRADEQRIRANLEVNLFGSIWTARAFFDALSRSSPRRDGRGACLLFIGSTAGRFGEKGHAEYAAGKAALHGLVRTLKNEIVELDPWGRVNLIEPGWTVTHMARPALQEPGTIARVVRTMPLRQLARAKDIARTAVFLASPAASRHVTGETITVAGGMEGRTLWEADDIDEDRVRRRLEQE